MALMSVWQILEIEPTSDTKSIKRAYAKKLKVTRPDEDPKGFQDLHWAYKTALQHAEWMAQQEAEDYQDNGPIDEQSESGPSLVQDAYEQESSDNHEQILTLDEDVYTSEPVTGDHTDEPSISTENKIETAEVATQYPEDNHQQEVAINPYQQEGEHLLGVAKLLLASDGDQAKSESWSFIIESPFILEDHFNWRLGLELLQLIREHNLGHAAQVHKIVGQEVMTYLDSIFNWNANRQQILRAMGEEYQTWLDMIRDSNQTDNWQDKIRGGKKITLANQSQTTGDQPKDSSIASPFRRFFAWLIDWGFIFFVIMLLKADRPDLSPIFASFVFPFLYFVFFESSQLQGTIGKRILGLKVVRLTLEPLKIMESISRTVCFLLYQTALVIAVVGVSMSIPFATFIIIGLYGYSFSKDPTLLYDRITKTRVIQTGK